MAYLLHLRAYGNPDLGQGIGGLSGVPSEEVTVADFAEASRASRAYIERHDLGGGNWGRVSGYLCDDATGQPAGKVSYNGKVWPPGDWNPGMDPLYPVEGA